MCARGSRGISPVLQTRVVGGFLQGMEDGFGLPDAVASLYWISKEKEQSQRRARKKGQKERKKQAPPCSHKTPPGHITIPHSLPSLLHRPLLLHRLDTLLGIHNLHPLRHTINHTTVKLGGIITREANLLGQVIRQDIQKPAITVLIKMRRVGELCVLVCSSGAAWCL